RAFRVVKRTAHLTVEVTERPEKVSARGGGSVPKRARGAKPKSRTATGAKKTGGRTAKASA
ncbi:MAG: hypothetical protein ABIX28_08600, partial [Vicinamibacterales bacterium]